MRRIDLREHGRSEHRLTVAQRDALRELLPTISIEPVSGTERTYSLNPRSTVGAVETGDLSVLIRPKIPMPQLLSLMCYAMTAFRPRRELFEYRREHALADVLALSLASAARRAFARGLLHGYRVEEEALNGVRGRIRFAEQIRRRFGAPLPVEVRYEEFTDDILANRLVKAAAARLGGMRLRSRDARAELGRMAAVLENVSAVEFAPGSVPEVRFDRLNDHYREVVTLSRLILRHTAFESRRGRVRASGFLVDMNVVFQEFVTRALTESLAVPPGAFRERPVQSLDVGGRVRLLPDLTWWQGGECVFVGDAKYKVADGRARSGDLYQMLAYITALDLPGGLLIYAEGDLGTAVHEVRHTGRRLEVASLDLSGTLDEVLGRVDLLALRVRGLRDEARALRLTA